MTLKRQLYHRGQPTGKALQRCVGTRRLRLPTLWNMTAKQSGWR